MNAKIGKRWEKSYNEGYRYSIYNPKANAFLTYAPSYREYVWLGDESTAHTFGTASAAEQWLEKHSAFNEGSVIARIVVRSVYEVSLV